MALFSVLTSKVFGGLLLAAIAFHVVDEIRDARALNEITTERNAAVTDLTTSRGNVISLKSGLNQCNQSAKNAAETAAAVSRAGAAAVRTVQAAGVQALNRTARNIRQAPAQTCEDAEAILRGEAG